jgi:predicted transcriptional regulator of viral defense system
MRFLTLLERAAHLPVIDSKTLRSWGGDPKALSVQLSRWVRLGKLVRLRRGVFLLPAGLSRGGAPLEYVANLLVLPSYVSLERALSFHGLIPERVPLVQSVTLARPMSFETAVGDFQYRHVKQAWFFGYAETEIGSASALMALPEKALLDMIYLSRGSFPRERIDEMRLQNLDRLRPATLIRMASGHGERMEAAAHELARWIRRERRS